MRNSTKSESLELLLNVVYEGAEPDHPWVKKSARRT